MSRIRTVGRRTAVASFIGIALALASAIAPATASVGTVEKCGFYEDAADAYYNHCGNSHVIVYVDETFWHQDWEWCYGPGVHRLGTAADVENAWYTGRTC